MTTFHGSEVVIGAKNASDVAYTDSDQNQSVTIDFDGGLHELYKMGSRDPQEIKAGMKSFSISIERHWENSNYASCGATLQSLAEASTEIWVAIYPEGDSSPEIKFANVKLGSYSLESSLDGEITESADGSFKSITVS